MRIVPVEARPEDGLLIGGHFKLAEVIGMPFGPGDVGLLGFCRDRRRHFSAQLKGRAQPDSGLLGWPSAPPKVFRCNQSGEVAACARRAGATVDNISHNTGNRGHDPCGLPAPQACRREGIRSSK